MARPETPIPSSAALGVASLARELRALRKKSGLTYSQLSARCHYSAGALSTAASGKTVPTWETVTAFVQGCGYEGDMEHWKRTHRTAQRDAGVRANNEDTGENPVPRQPSLLTRARRRPPPNPPTVPRPEGLLSLIQEFMEKYQPDELQRVTTPTVDHMHTALALCTTPDDVIVLMNELVVDKGLSIQKLVEHSRKHYEISGSTFAQVLRGHELPTTEFLHIFLSACGLEQARTVIWHYTVTRIKIANLRHRQRLPARSSRFSRGALFKVGVQVLGVQVLTVLATLLVLRVAG